MMNKSYKSYKSLNIKRLWICDQPHEQWWEYLYNSYQIKSPHNSKHFTDIYTLTHVWWPMAMMFIGKKVLTFSTTNIAIVVAVIVTIFEIFENLPAQIVKYNRIEVDTLGESTYRGDSMLNLFGDLLFNFVGIYLGYTLLDNAAIAVLSGLFLIITNIVGLSYWTDFFKFLFKFPLS